MRVPQRTFGGPIVKCMVYDSLIKLNFRRISLYTRKTNIQISSIYKWGFRAKKPQNEKNKFPNLLILEHLKSHFIKPLK